jgi:hypothetical protein
MDDSILLVFFNHVEDIGNRLVRSIVQGINSIDCNVRIKSGSYKITNKITKYISPTELVFVLPPFLASKLTSRLVSNKTMSPLLPHQPPGEVILDRQQAQPLDLQGCCSPFAKQPFLSMLQHQHVLQE